MHKQVFKLVFIFFLLFSCVTTRLDLPEDKSKIPVLLPFKVNELKITDQRDSLKSMDWNLPLMTLKKKEWIGNPEVSLQNKEDMERIVRSTEPKEDGVPANFEIKIIDGECKLISRLNVIREYVKFKAELSLTIPDRNKKYGATSEGYYEYPVYEAKKEHMMELYNLVVRNVTNELMKVVRDEIGK